MKAKYAIREPSTTAAATTRAMVGSQLASVDKPELPFAVIFLLASFVCVTWRLDSIVAPTLMTTAIITKAIPAAGRSVSFIASLLVGEVRHKRAEHDRRGHNKGNGW